MSTGSASNTRQIIHLACRHFEGLRDLWSSCPVFVCAGGEQSHEPGAFRYSKRHADFIYRRPGFIAINVIDLESCTESKAAPFGDIHEVGK